MDEALTSVSLAPSISKKGSPKLCVMFLRNGGGNGEGGHVVKEAMGEAA